MKNEWIFKPLKEICLFSNGLWKGKKKPFENVGVIRNTNFRDDGFLDYTDIAYLDVESKQLEKRRLVFGDIILEKSGGGPKQPVGRVALFNKKTEIFSFSNFTAAMRVINPDQVNYNYLHKFLYWSYISGVTERMQSHSTGIRNLDNNAYKNIPIPLPPLHEQHRIVAILDEAFDAIAKAKANTEKNLQNARALFESHLNDVFTKRGEGWVEKCLGEVSHINYGYTESASYSKIGPHFLRITDIQNNVVDWATVPFCQIDEDNFPKYSLNNGDIVFARTGATTGKSYLVSNPPHAVFASYLIRVQIRETNLKPEFVNLFFQTHSYWNTIRSGVSGSAQGGFNASKLSQLVIPFPLEAKTQETIITELNEFGSQTRRLEALYEQKLSALEVLKKSLLQRAFTGEL